MHTAGYSPVRQHREIGECAGDGFLHFGRYFVNFYSHHIGDFNNATRHLSRLERSIYRDMLELYYDTEKPLTDDFDKLARRCLVADEERGALREVLNEFFLAQDDGYHNVRADKEIAAYEKAKNNHWALKLSRPQRAAIQAKRNATKKHATPRWLTKGELSDIDNLYVLCALETSKTGVPHEVDHIVPLRSELVCGLHVLCNLRIVSACKNRSKSNRFAVE